VRENELQNVEKNIISGRKQELLNKRKHPLMHQKDFGLKNVTR